MFLGCLLPGGQAQHYEKQQGRHLAVPSKTAGTFTISLTTCDVITCEVRRATCDDHVRRSTCGVHVLRDYVRSATCHVRRPRATSTCYVATCQDQGAI